MPVVTARTRIRWIEFRECGVALRRKAFVENKTKNLSELHEVGDVVRKLRKQYFVSEGE